MPWKVWSVMDERLKFVARRLEGESMSQLCREFGISRTISGARTTKGSSCWGPALLLPVDHHRSGEPVAPGVRRVDHDARSLCVQCV